MRSDISVIMANDRSSETGSHDQRLWLKGEVPITYANDLHTLWESPHMRFLLQFTRQSGRNADRILFFLYIIAKCLSNITQTH